VVVKVKDLANKQFWFAIVKTPGRMKHVSYNNVWHQAKKYKVAGPKGKGGDYRNLPYIDDDLDHFLDYIDQLGNNLTHFNVMANFLSCCSV
jgi:hypothetical protein